MKELSNDSSRLTKFAGGITLGCALVISACGDSDLPELQRDAIVAAQQQALAAEQANAGIDTDDSDAGSDTTDTDTTDNGDGDGSEDTTNDPVTTPEGDPNPLVTAPEPEPETPNSIDLEGYQLVFNENFDSNEINAAKWNTGLRWGTNVVVNNEEQYYIDIQNSPNFGYNPFRHDTDSIAIGAAETPTELVSAANNQPYISGVLTTADKFSFTEGVAEIRAKIPAGAGLWPQFWLLPDEFTGLKPQLFVMEARGDNTSEIFHTYKYQDENDDVQTTGVLTTQGGDFSADFHTYSVEWSPSLLVFYIDGIEYQRVESENIASQPMYLILNLAVGGWFPGSPDETTVLPAELVIDHVRVYQKIQ